MGEICILNGRDLDSGLENLCSGRERCSVEGGEIFILVCGWECVIPLDCNLAG